MVYIIRAAASGLMCWFLACAKKRNLSQRASVVTLSKVGYSGRAIARKLNQCLWCARNLEEGSNNWYCQG